MTADENKTGTKVGAAEPENRDCGIVRPIAPMAGYEFANHWLEVHELIADAVKAAGYSPRLVSDVDAAGVIHGSIVSNLYNDALIICDVSGRNPNVMFELGMRIAFEKPVIIVKDYDTPFTFDLQPVKHLRYPASLRYSSMIDFKAELIAEINETMAEASKPDRRPGYLQQFGKIKATQIKDQSVSMAELASEVQEIRRMLKRFDIISYSKREAIQRASGGGSPLIIPLTKFNMAFMAPGAEARITQIPQVLSVKRTQSNTGDEILMVHHDESLPEAALREIIGDIMGLDTKRLNPLMNVGALRR